MKDLVLLSPVDMFVTALLVLLLAWVGHRQNLGVSRVLLISALRMGLQLTLVGLVLKLVFDIRNLTLVLVISLVMLLLAGREVMARQRYRFFGAWGYGVGTFSMLVSSFVITLLVLILVIQPEPWHDPRYAIPLLGMMLGNTMNSIALGIERLLRESHRERGAIEARLLAGEPWHEAIAPLRREAVRTAIMPIINAMSAAGIISLPGMMTGQILGGSAPMDAVAYQVLIMLMIAAGTGFGVMVAITLACRRLFDERHRLRLDRLYKKG